jgi:hypothetical protein
MRKTPVGLALLFGLGLSSCVHWPVFTKVADSLPPIPAGEARVLSTGRSSRTNRSRLRQFISMESRSATHGMARCCAACARTVPRLRRWRRRSRCEPDAWTHPAWSGLPCYLYGVHPQIIDDPGGRRAVSNPVSALAGDQKIPAGLFRDPSMAHLSAVIFSNAATFSKFNRMGFLAGWRPPGLTMVRDGVLFDRTPGALESKPFRLDVLSEEYAALWPGTKAAARGCPSGSFATPIERRGGAAPRAAAPGVILLD